MPWIDDKGFYKGGIASLALVIGASLFLASGCAPLLVAGGAVGGYAAAKDMDDGKLIDK
jgi:hypothetical protein